MYTWAYLQWLQPFKSGTAASNVVSYIQIACCPRPLNWFILVNKPIIKIKLQQIKTCLFYSTSPAECAQKFPSD